MQKQTVATLLVVLAVAAGIWGYLHLTNRNAVPHPDLSNYPEKLVPETPKAQAETSEASYGPESQMRMLTYTDYTRLYPGIVLRSGDPNSRNVALTFDDGPDNKYTPQILDILKSYGVKATFFFLGQNAEKYPDVVKRAANEGHLIATHGYTHANFANLTPDQIRDNLQRSRRILESLSGKQISLFRPPYAAINSRAVETIAAEGYKIVLWNVDSLDWKSLPKETVLANILPATTAGSIILQHSAGGPGEDLSGTVRALPNIISTLKSRGYRLVTVDQLLELDSKGSVTSWYTVKPGDTFYTISKSHGMTLRALMDLNPNVDPNYLYVGQKLAVSGVGQTNKQSVPESGNYTVQPGDTLWKIGQRFGLSTAQLQKLNPSINPNYLYPGLVLKVRTTGDTGSTYTVQPGDTLWKISQKLGLSVSTLQQLNPNVSPNQLYVGQKLNTSGGSSTSGTYTVKSGDSLWTISRKLGVSIAKLQTLNPGINPNQIYVGQRLQVP